MGANLNKILIVDIESTCWETPEEQGEQVNEVIEIGMCELILASNEIVNKMSYVVKPEASVISPFCTRLTGWTQEAVDKGLSMPETLKKIEHDFKITKNHVWFSYGEYDRVKLSSDTEQPGGLYELYGIIRCQNPFAYMRAHYNVKTLMALKERLKREIGMARALEYYKLEPEGRHHNGADDAYNIAKIVSKVLS